MLYELRAIACALSQKRIRILCLTDVASFFGNFFSNVFPPILLLTLISSLRPMIYHDLNLKAGSINYLWYYRASSSTVNCSTLTENLLKLSYVSFLDNGLFEPSRNFSTNVIGLFLMTFFLIYGLTSGTYIGQIMSADCGSTKMGPKIRYVTDKE